jgi:hypothetical protein
LTARRARRLAVWLALTAAVSAGHAASLEASRFCDRATELTATEQDRLLRFAAIARQELEASGQRVALVSRAGLDLARFGLRYSHAGVSLKASPNGAWSVRQLYYACDEARPRLFDQGLAGFVSGTDDPRRGHLSIVLLPSAEALALERAALDKALALGLLAGRYSANAPAYGLDAQNCNQWVMELLAAAWGAPVDAAATDGAAATGATAPGPDTAARAAAQRWLRAQGYAPPAVPVGSHLLMLAAHVIPWVHVSGHPQDDVFALRFHTTTPAAIEAFVRERLPGAQRIELCHDERQVVIRRGWEPLADGCRPADGDRVVVFDTDRVEPARRSSLTD